MPREHQTRSKPFITYEVDAETLRLSSYDVTDVFESEMEERSIVVVCGQSSTLVPHRWRYRVLMEQLKS